MTYMDEEFLENDLDWFLCDRDGFVAHFATGGKGPVPLGIRKYLDNYDLVFNYFLSLEPFSVADVVVDNVPHFLDEIQKESYLSPFIKMSHIGLFSYDFKDGYYKLISKPKRPLEYDELSDFIKRIIFVSSEKFS